MEINAYVFVELILTQFLTFLSAYSGETNCWAHTFKGQTGLWRSCNRLNNCKDLPFALPSTPGFLYVTRTLSVIGLLLQVCALCSIGYAVFNIRLHRLVSAGLHFAAGLSMTIGMAVFTVEVNGSFLGRFVTSFGFSYVFGWVSAASSLIGAITIFVLHK